MRGLLARDGGGMSCALHGAAGGRSLLARDGEGRRACAVWQACVARWRVDGVGVAVCVCRVGAWRHMLATAAARSQESRRANAVRLTLLRMASVGL